LQIHIQCKTSLINGGTHHQAVNRERYGLMFRESRTAFLGRYSPAQRGTRSLYCKICLGS
jgi:hypothetical protein